VGFRHRHDVVIMKIVSAAKNRIHNWQERRFLRKNGCRSWNEYYRVYDPDYNIRADKLRDYYHGYPYWHVFDNYNHYCYKVLADYGPGGLIYGFHYIRDWCKDNTKHKFRMDGLRVYQFDNEWHINELSGEDRMVFAFKDERNYAWFMLRWS